MGEALALIMAILPLSKSTHDESHLPVDLFVQVDTQ